MPNIDPAPADIVEFRDAHGRFIEAFSSHPGAWHDFLLWRIAEQLERLADYSMVETMDEPPVEPWRDNGEDDE